MSKWFAALWGRIEAFESESLQRAPWRPSRGRQSRRRRPRRPGHDRHSRREPGTDADGSPLAHVEGGIAQSAVDADGVAIVRSVKLEGRAFTDKKFAYFYGGCIGLFVILSIVLFAGQHDEYTFKGSDVTGVGECENSDRQTRAARPIIIPWAARARPWPSSLAMSVLTRVLLPSQITRRMPWRAATRLACFICFRCRAS